MIKPRFLFLVQAILSLGLIGFSIAQDAKISSTETRVDTLGDPLPSDALLRFGTTRLKNPDQRCNELNSGNTFCFSPDGAMMVITGRGSSSHRTTGTTHVYDTNTGKLLLPPIIDSSCSLAFFPDGERILMRLGGPSRLDVYVTYNIKTGKLTFLDDVCGGSDAIVSPNGKVYASSDFKDIRICSIQDIKVLYHLKNKKSVENDKLFSPDGKHLLSTTKISTSPPQFEIDIWDVEKGTLSTSLPASTRQLAGMALIRGGTLLLAAERGKRWIAWDFASQNDIDLPEYPLPEKEIYRLVGSPDGKYLAIQEGNDKAFGDIRILETTRFKLIGTIPTWGKSMHKLVFSPDSKRLAVSGHIPGVKLWDVATCKEIAPMPGHEQGIITVSFSADGKTLASRSFGQTVRFWDLASGKERKQFRIGPILSGNNIEYTGLSAFCLPEPGKLVVMGAETPAHREDTLLIWDTENGKSPRVIPLSDKPAKKPVYGVASSPDGQVIGAVTGDSLVLWSLRTGERLAFFPGNPETYASCLTFSPDGLSVLLGRSSNSTNRGEIEVFDWSSRRLIRTITTAHGWTSSIAVAPSYGYLARSSGTLNWSDEDREPIELLDFPTGQTIRLLKGHDGPTRCVAISPDGHLLASAGIRDRLVRLWNVWTGEELAQFKGHEGAVTTVAFSPDSKMLASGSADTTILVWDVSKYTVKPPPTGDDPEKLNKLWQTVHTGTTTQCYEALWELAGAGDASVTLLKKELRRVVAVPADRIKEWIADLDSANAQKREEAFEELRKIGPPTKPLLRATLSGKVSVETKARLEELLDGMNSPVLSGTPLRESRAVLLLELIGTPSARELLQNLAGGADNVPLTVRARAALERLKKR